MLPLLAAAEDGLGRLFYTPDERATLDASRNGLRLPSELPSPPQAPAVTAAIAAPPAPVAAVRIDGMVVRGKGPSTAWINGQAGTRSDLSVPGGQQISIGRHAVDVTEQQSGARATIKPGQVYDPAAGRVLESFEHADAPPTAAR